MTQTKWTSGPWFVCEKKTSKPQGMACVYAADDELRYIAECDDFGNVDVITDNVANAHLIAAAPDLYEALETITDRAECAKRFGGDKFNFGRMITKSRAALAKARGEV